MGVLSSIKRRWWQPQIQGACSIQAMNGSRPGQVHSPIEKNQRCLHCQTKCPPYHEALTTQSMVDGEVLKVPLLLRHPPDSHAIDLFPKFECQLIRSNDPGPIVYFPMAVGLGKGKAMLQILRSEVGIFGSDSQMLPQFVDLALNHAS
ncbi:hypothetical protein O181_128794 [Austropuccinia psidii MF-1]|uniref:Uncharacterized protein n=1 Tax=Austropuccinia psidii MF-1 TaxID=1389203 RepID=A0A9Q3KXW7_9BASI|nr:hypothetical protein [Austropuccinia psidii MF-1]